MPRAVIASVAVLLALTAFPNWAPVTGKEQVVPADPRARSLTATDLPAGFEPDSSQTLYSQLPEGGLLNLVVFRRTLDGTGPVMARNTVNSLVDADAARALYATMPAVLAGQGFGPASAPAVGEESSGYSSPDTLDGSPVVYQTIIYRLASFVVLTTLVGPPATTTLQQTAALARVTAARIALTPGQDAPRAESSPRPAASPGREALAPPGGDAVSPPVTPGILLSGTLNQAPDVGSGVRLGGFSGLVALDETGGLFLTVTDRGPNDELGSGKNKKMTFPEPGYTPSIVKFRLQDGQLHVLERTPLKLTSGFTDPITGSQNVSGISNTERDETPWGKNGGDRLPLDPNGIDSEGLALDRRDGSYWICEEYGPSVLHVAADGTILLRLVPRGFGVNAPGENVRDVLADVLVKRKSNRGFEGIGLSPDGTTLLALMQSALSEPDKATGEASRNIRLVTLDVSNGAEPRVSGEYLYLAEPASQVGGEQDHVTVGDLAAEGPTRALVVERDNDVGGRHKMVYAIDLAGATNLLERGPSRGKTIEQMAEAELRTAGIRPVAKAAVADLAGYGYSPEKLEGLAIVDSRTIAAVNDNDFGFSGFDDAGRATPSGVETRLVLVRLEKPLQ